MVSLFDEGPFAPCPAPFNLAAHVLAAGQKTLEKDALVLLSRNGSKSWSFAELTHAVLNAAQGLLDVGLRPDDILVMRLGNTVEFPIVFLAALAAGMVPVPTSPALTTAETKTIFETVSPAAVVRDPALACAYHPNTVTIDMLTSHGRKSMAEFQMGDPDRLGYIVFTSGTSSTPRAVAHAHRAIWARQMMFDHWYALRGDDRLMHAGAFNWTYTLGTGLLDPWTKGATALIPAPDTGPEMLPGLMAVHKATIFAAAPGVYRQMLARAPKIEAPSLRHGLSAGEPLARSTRAQWTAATRTDIYEAFGMSECSTFVSQSPLRDAEPETMGRPQPGRRVALVKNGKPVPRGETGTVAVSRNDPGLMLGYYGAPEATAQKMEGSWFLTGDLAVMDKSGAFIYQGRNDDMINAGGIRVSPLEIERVLIGCEGIEAIAVTEVEIKADTRVIAAFYTGPAPLDESTLHAYVEDKLARYKHPRLYIHKPALPFSANGKIQRRKLQAGFERLS
ncbi:MAG: class I adenylate-forming enzyme family protein [Pseudomonadota bacterium]